MIQKLNFKLFCICKMARVGQRKDDLTLIFMTHLNSGLLNHLVRAFHYVISASLVSCSGLSDETTWANKNCLTWICSAGVCQTLRNSLIHAHSWQSIQLHRWSELGHTVLFILGAPTQTKWSPAACNFGQIYFDCKTRPCKQDLWQLTYITPADPEASFLLGPLVLK